jgi:hypothetical protein
LSKEKHPRQQRSRKLKRVGKKYTPLKIKIMKKILTSALVASLATILFSCQKENISAPVTDVKQAGSKSAQAVSNGFNNTVTDPPVNAPYILSSWFAVQLIPVSLGQNNNYLAGQVIFNSQLPENDDVKLAYVKSVTIHDVNGFAISQLPIDVKTNTGNVHLWFDLRAYDPGSTAFALYAENEDQSIMPDPGDFKSNQYRYLVVPRTTYLTLHVDWSNYQAVANALSFTP